MVEQAAAVQQPAFQVHQQVVGDAALRRCHVLQQLRHKQSQQLESLAAAVVLRHQLARHVLLQEVALFDGVDAEIA